MQNQKILIVPVDKKRSIGCVLNGTPFKVLIMEKYIYSIILLFLIGCSGERKSIQQIKVSVDNVNNDNVAFLNHSFIKLETSDECLLENVTKTQMADDGIYLLSSFGGNVFKFSKNGEFIWKLSKGTGPDDVNFVTDINFSEADNCLYVLDGYRTIKKYNSDGSYVGKDDLVETTFLFERTSAGYMLFNPNLTTRSTYYLTLQKDGTLINSCLPILENLKKVSFMPSNVFVASDKEDEFYIQHMLSDTIYRYRIQTNELISEFYINTGGKSMNSRDIEFPNTRSFDEISKREGLISGIAGLSVLNGKMYMMMYYRDKQWYIVHDLETKETITTNRMCHGLPNSLRCVGREKDYVVYSYRPEELYDKEDELGETAKNLLREIKEDDNPVLVLFN